MKSLRSKKFHKGVGLITKSRSASIELGSVNGGSILE